jgi:IMP dehydrogenase
MAKFGNVYDSSEPSLDFKDVFIVPQYSEIESRKKVYTAARIGPRIELEIDIPVISANMDTVSGAEMCIAMAKGGGFGAMHRFMRVQENVDEYKKVKAAGHDCFVSVGVNDDSKHRAEKLYYAGARYFIIDIAHGHSLLMHKMIDHLRYLSTPPGPINVPRKSDIVIMAGNVATPEGVKDLHKWGAHIVKIGIGPGSVCLTKNVTGVTVPQFTAILKCAEEGRKRGIPVIADGGFNEFGDICKAIGAGATAVMSGKFFAGCNEAAGTRNHDGKKEYRGMASKEAMSVIKREEDMATPEGKSIIIHSTGVSAVEVLNDIRGSLQSALSYSNSHNLIEFREKVHFGIRKSTH